MKAKRILAGLLAFLMMMSFASCKGDDSGMDSGKDDNNNSIKDIFNQSEKAEYEDDRALFCAQNRVDTSGDEIDVYYYNYNGDLVKKITSFDVVKEYYAENGLTVAYDNATSKYGFADKDGVFQIEPIYSGASAFSKNGIALVRNEEGKKGYIDSKGDQVISFIYDEATSFFDCGYAIVATNREVTDESGYTDNISTYFIIDEKGNELVEIDEEKSKIEIEAVYEDYYVYTRSVDSNIYVLDYKGNELKVIDKYIGDLFIVPRFEKDGLYLEYYDGSEEVENSYCCIGVVEKGAKYLKTEKFNGKNFEITSEYEITSKRVSTTLSGYGYGIEKNGKTLIPFEYDIVQPYGSYYVGIKFTGYNATVDQIIDIYDSEFNKTAEDVEYAFLNRQSQDYEYSRLPDGYFAVSTYSDEREGEVQGIIDYTGKLIVDPVFYRGIYVCTYEGVGHFDLNRFF